MATTVARVEIDADLDGSDIPRQAKALGEAAGRAAGENLSKSFDKSANSGMADALKKIGSQFSAGGAWDKAFLGGGRRVGSSLVKGFTEETKTFFLEFDKIGQEIAKVEDAVDRVDFGRWARDMNELGTATRALGGDFDRLAIGPGILDDLGELFQVFEDGDDDVRRAGDGFTILWRELESGTSSIHSNTSAFRENTDQVNRSQSGWRRLGNTIGRVAGSWGGGIGNAFNKLSGHFDDMEPRLEKHQSLWQGLSHNTRQWTLIIGAVIAALPELAVLSSAAGSGLFTLAGAAAALVPGFAVAIWSMKVLSQDVEDLPEELQAARRGLTQFGNAWQDLGKDVAISVFTEAQDAFDDLAATTRALTPAMKSLGTVVGRVFGNFAKSIAPGTEAFNNLAGFIEKSGPIFERVMNIVGKFGAALLAAFNNPNFQRSISEMIGWIEKVFDTFDAFLRGPGFNEWLDHGRDVFGAFGRLLDTTGRLLNNLVRDETVEQLVNFIDNIDRFLQGGGKGILDFAQKLNIFGLIAEALADFGDALQPLAKPMAEFAGGLNKVIHSGIDTLAPIIEDIAEALAPFIENLANFMKKNPKAVSDALIALSVAFLALKAVKIAAIAGEMLLFFGSVSKGSGIISAFNTTKLGKIATGIAGVGAIAAAQIIPDSFWEQFDIESNLPQSVLTGAGFGAMFGIWGAAIGAGLGVVYSLFTDFENTMNDIGLNLVAVLTTGPWGLAGTTALQWFTDLVPAEWQTSDNPMERFVATFATAIEDWGTTTTIAFDEVSKLFDGASEDAGVLEADLGIFFANTKLGFETWKTDVTTTWVQTWSNLNNPLYWDTIAVLIGTWLGTMYANFVTNTTNIKDTWATMWTLLNNGTYWDVITTSVSVWWVSMKAVFTSKQSEVATAWVSFWSGLKGGVESAQPNIVSAVVNIMNGAKRELTNFALTAGSGWNSFWSGLAGAVEDAYWRIASWVSKIIAAAQSAANASSSAGSNPGNSPRIPGPTAAGGLFNGMQFRMIGEAGPEAVVPLRRSLNMVDPSVRWLSAIAQGRAPAMAGGGVVGGGKTLTVENININEAGDARRSANDVITRLAEYVNG